MSSLFLQYKRSKKLQDKRAKTEQWNAYCSEFFRFKVRTANKGGDMEQHELLCRYADGGTPVYYVAPEFVDWMDYQRYAQNETVIDNSVFIDCKTAPRPTDTDRHYICQHPADSVALFFSEEPDRIRTVRGGQSLSLRSWLSLNHNSPHSKKRALSSSGYEQVLSKLLESKRKSIQIPMP